MRKRHWFPSLLAAWLAFIAFGTALAILVPLGEGFDEPRHLAYVQRIAQAGDVPMGHTAFLSAEIAQFLENHPVGRSLEDLYPSLLSYDEYWNEKDSVREAQDQVVRNLRFSGRYVEATGSANSQYERHQPPLYYLVTAPVFAIAARSLSFADTFLVVRVWSVLLASLMVPATFLLAKGLFADPVSTDSVLLLTLVFPGLYSGVVRVANDALALPIATWLLACMVQFFRTERRSFLFGASILFAAGLWTKAFFIPLVIGTLLTLWVIGYFRQSIALLAAASIGAVWYVYNFSSTGSVTGLPETVASGSSLTSSFEALSKLDWRNLARVIRSSHIWAANASLLSVREWMYRLISWIFVVGVCGCCLYRRSAVSRRALLLLFVNYLLFLGAMVYFATQVFQSSGLSVAQGWYLTFLIPLEAGLFTAGVRSLFLRYWPACAGLFAVLLLSLNIYASLFVMFPYYAGVTTSGHPGAYVPAVSDLERIPERLLRFHPWIPTIVPLLLIGVFIAAGLWLTARLFFSSGKDQPA